MIPSQRHLYDIPRDVAYLNCAYMSPLMHAVVAAGEKAVRRKAHPWEIAASDFFDESERLRTAFARLVNADADGVALIPAASYGVAVAAHNLPVFPGRSVLMLADQFPSNVYAWRAVAGGRGADVVTVPRPADGDWTPAVLAAINQRTAVAALPHCHWTDGGVLDLERIGRRCREVGAALALDVTQSAGALPLDVARVKPDFLVAAGYKWLMCPYSIGFLYVAPRWRDGEPLEHNWIARAGSDDFAGLVDYVDAMQPGARRFDVGERANFALVPMALTAIEQILEWGVAAIADTLAARTAAIAERAAALGLRSLPGERRAGHFLGLRFPDDVPADLLANLAAERVFVSLRGDSMRVTPHLYNDDEDVDRLLGALERSLRPRRSRP